VISKSPTLDYAAGKGLSAEATKFRREMIIYGLGVGIALLLQFYIWASWPKTSNGIDPIKARLFAEMQVVGGTAFVWLAMGLRRILCSRLGRRSAVIWFLVIVNAAAVYPFLFIIGASFP
jgi:hypothetical protein